MLARQGQSRFAWRLRLAALLVAAGLLVATVAWLGCGGSGLVIPPVRTQDGFIRVSVRADNTQAPLAGALLNVAGPSAAQVTPTGPGQFEVRVAPGATYMVTATAAGFVAVSKQVQVPSREGLASSVARLVLALPPALPGVVLDPAGGNIDAGNGVTLRVPAGAVAAPTAVTLVIGSKVSAPQEPVPDGPQGPVNPALGTLEITPAGLAFALPVEVVIPRALLQIEDALVGPGLTFELWVADATGQFVLATGTAVYRAASDSFVVTLNGTGSYQIRAGLRVEIVDDLTRSLGTLTSAVGAGIPAGTAQYDYSTESTSADPTQNAVLGARFGFGPGENLSVTNPAVPGSDGFITEATTRQVGARVRLYRGTSPLGTADYYGPNIFVTAVRRPPPRTGGG